ncbi:MAG: phosphate acyltransferase, partial [Acidobacteriota bacterium]|nr:phosphate acyltransferase [Acidobacteriota bacterium]
MQGLPESATAFLTHLKSRARELRRTIVFPEGSDSRVIAAALRLQQEGVAEPVLITSTPQANLRCIDPANSELARKYASMYHERRRAKGITEIEAADITRKPLYFGALMVAAGDAHGCVAGAANTTSHVVRAALHCVGTA